MSYDGERTRGGRDDEDDDDWSEEDAAEEREAPRRAEIIRYGSSRSTKNHNPNDPQYEEEYPERERSQPIDSRDNPSFVSSESSDGTWNSFSTRKEAKNKESTRGGPESGTRESTPEVTFIREGVDYSNEEDDNNAEHLISETPTAQTRTSAIRVIRFDPTDKKLGIQFGLKSSRFTGPLVTIANVEVFSLAEEKGVKKDWVLTHLDGEPISVHTSKDFEDFIDRVAGKRPKGLTLSFNTLLLTRLRRRMNPTYIAKQEKDKRNNPRRRESARQMLEDALNNVRKSKGRSDYWEMHLRAAIRWAKKFRLSTREAEDELKRVDILNLFDKLGLWHEPDHGKDMTDYEKEMTDLEGRICNLQSAVERATALDIDTADPRDTVWKLQCIYRYCKKLGSWSKETRFFLLRIQELLLDIQLAKSSSCMRDSRKQDNRIRKLKKKVSNAAKHAINLEKPIALKVVIAVAKKAGVQISIMQDVLDVIEGITEHSLKQNTKMMRRTAEDGEQLNIDCSHIWEFATFLDTQKLTIIVCVNDEGQRETPGGSERRSRRKKSRKAEADPEWEFDMFRFSTLQDLKLEVFKRHKVSYFAQKWSYRGKDMSDNRETLRQLGAKDGSELELFVKNWDSDPGNIDVVLDVVECMQTTLNEDMQETEGKLICAINDQDFHNFLRFSALLRAQWCQKQAAKIYSEAFEKMIEDGRKSGRSRRDYRLKFSKYERDRNPNDFSRKTPSPRDRFYSSDCKRDYPLASSPLHYNQCPPSTPTEFQESERRTRRNREVYKRDDVSYGGVLASPDKSRSEFKRRRDWNEY